METNPPIEEIEHTADWSIRVRGRDLRELFANAARGMFGLMADLDAVEPDVTRRVELEEYDAETLLVAWLSELLWFNEESNLVFVGFDIEALTPTRLQATAHGGQLSNPEKEIKAVTYHDLEIIQTGQGYEVTLVFDV